MNVKQHRCFKKCLILSGVIAIVAVAVIFVCLRNSNPEKSLISSQMAVHEPYLDEVSPTSNSFSAEHDSTQEPYLYDVPPAPPFREIEIDVTNIIEEGCGEAPNNLIGYIIEIKEDGVSDRDLIVQDENGVRHKCYVEANRLDNAQRSWLPYILIPGNKVSMRVQYCGSGGFIYVMKMKSLKRY